MQKKDTTVNKGSYWLLGILILGAFLRFLKIDYQSLWLDELYTIIPTAPENSVSSIIEYCRHDQPPLFFLAVHFAFKIFGYTEVVGRMVSACLGLMSIIAIYRLGKEIKNNEVGLFAAFLTSINFFHIYYSQELRFYSLVFLLSTLSYLFFFRILSHLKLKSLLLYTVCTIALLYTHYYGLFVFGTQGATFIYLISKNRKYALIPYGIMAVILISLAYLPWIPTLLTDLAVKTEDFWIKRPSPYFVAEYFYDYTGKEVVTTLVFVSCIFFFVKAFIVQKSRASLALIFWVALCYLIPYLWSIVNTPILHNRYTIIVLPAWFLVFSLGWDQLQNIKLKYAIIGVLVISMAVNFLFFKKYYVQITKDQFRESSQFVINHNQENYPICAPDPLSWHFNYYFRNQRAKVISLNEIENVKKFWMLQSHFSTEQQDMIVQKLSDQYIVVEKHSFYKASAYLMEHK